MSRAVGGGWGNHKVAGSNPTTAMSEAPQFPFTKVSARSKFKRQVVQDVRTQSARDPLRVCAWWAMHVTSPAVMRLLWCVCVVTTRNPVCSNDRISCFRFTVCFSQCWGIVTRDGDPTRSVVTSSPPKRRRGTTRWPSVRIKTATWWAFRTFTRG